MCMAKRLFLLSLFCVKNSNFFLTINIFLAKELQKKFCKQKIQNKKKL